MPTSRRSIRPRRVLYRADRADPHRRDRPRDGSPDRQAPARTDEAKARAIYDWIVDNPSATRRPVAAGLGDIDPMLESRQSRRQVRRPQRALRRPRPRRRVCLRAMSTACASRQSKFGYRSLGASTAECHPCAALPGRGVACRLRLGAGRSGRRAQGRPRGATGPLPLADAEVPPRAPRCSAPGK